MTYRISQLSMTQRVLLILQAVLVLLGIILYAAVGGQQVIRFGDGRLKVGEENGAAVYAGKSIKLVARDDTLEHYENGELAATYTVTEDPTAVPTEGTADLVVTDPDSLRGVEIRHNGILLFRGSYRIISDTIFCFDENGDLSVLSSVDRDGLNASTVLSLLYDPDVESRGDLRLILLGVFLSVLNAVSILFADELFRWNLRFSIRNVEDAEPSDWELFSRGLSWVLLMLTSLVSLLLGALGVS